MGREPIGTEGGSSSAVGRKQEIPHSLGRVGRRDGEVSPKLRPSSYRRLTYTSGLTSTHPPQKKNHHWAELVAVAAS